HSSDRLFQADSTNTSSRPLNGIVKPFLFFDSSIGNRITCASRSMCLCSNFFAAPLLIPVRYKNMPLVSFCFSGVLSYEPLKRKPLGGYAHWLMTHRCYLWC